MGLNLSLQSGCFGIMSDALDRRFCHWGLQVLLRINEYGRKNLTDVARLVRFAREIVV